MKAYVVYESMYGNTAAIGEAIAEELRTRGLTVRSGPVTRVDPDGVGDAGLVIVGGPTHAHGMTRGATRRTAVNDKKNTYASPTVAPGLREWIDDLPTGAKTLAAAFDTRFAKPVFLTGSAAKGIARRLANRGFHMVVGPKSFFVSTDNQLLPGELDHATRWASALVDHPSLAAVGMGVGARSNVSGR